MTIPRILLAGLVWFALSTLSVVVQAEASAAHAFLEVEAPNEPVVAAIDGGPHLVYEAHITNFGSMPVTLTRIDLLRYPGTVLIHSYAAAELESWEVTEAIEIRPLILDARKQTSTQLRGGGLEPQAKGTDVFGLWPDHAPISKLLKAMSRPSEHTAYGKYRGE